jgi:uncharacterized protein with PQ loop repeat
MSIEWIGWLSSLLLIGTMAKQVSKQWETRLAKGVSHWLYLGQLLAEIGFVTYSFFLKNWVFVFTNTVLLGMNLIGLITLARQRGKLS